MNMHGSINVRYSTYCALLWVLCERAVFQRAHLSKTQTQKIPNAQTHPPMIARQSIDAYGTYECIEYGYNMDRFRIFYH